LVCTDENYIKILKVIQLLHVHNTYIHLEYKSNFLLPGVFRRMLIDLNLTFVKLKSIHHYTIKSFWKTRTKAISSRKKLITFITLRL
jgi:hypothetical protein